MGINGKSCSCDVCEKEQDYGNVRKKSVWSKEFDVELCSSCGTFIHHDGSILTKKEVEDLLISLIDRKNQVDVCVTLFGCRLYFMTHLATLYSMQFINKLKEEYREEWYKHYNIIRNKKYGEFIEIYNEAEKNNDLDDLIIFDPTDPKWLKGPKR